MADELEIDVLERGAPRDGAPQQLDRRLFMQLLVFDTPSGTDVAAEGAALRDALRAADARGVIYEDVNHPRSLGLLTWSEDPALFVQTVRPIVTARAALQPRPDFTMLGRTYSTGYEPDLEFFMLRRPVETVLEEAWPWHVWYPLRRIGAFERLEPRERGGILREHGEIGKAYGRKDLAHDVRLACHGLDANDNEFVIGLIGKTLYPLSHVVQSMRKTRQTAEYMAKMGPFFVGYARWRA